MDVPGYIFLFVNVNIAFWIEKSVLIDLINAPSGIKRIRDLSLEKILPERSFQIEDGVRALLAVVAEDIADALNIAVKPFFQERDQLFPENAGEGDKRVFVCFPEEEPLPQLVICAQKIGETQIDGRHEPLQQDPFHPDAPQHAGIRRDMPDKKVVADGAEHGVLADIGVASGDDI